MTNPNFGVLSYLVQLLGFSDFRWASDPSTALFTVVLVDVWVYTPFIMILLLAGLRSLAWVLGVGLSVALYFVS